MSFEVPKAEAEGWIEVFIKLLSLTEFDANIGVYSALLLISFFGFNYKVDMFAATALVKIRDSCC